MFETLFPQLKIVKAFFTSMQGMFWIIFALIFLFIGIGVSCNKKEDPVVSVVNAPISAIPNIQADVAKDTNTAIVEDRKNEKETTAVVETAKKNKQEKIKKIKADAELTPDQSDSQIAAAEIDSLHDLYNQFYGTTTLSGPPVSGG